MCDTILQTKDTKIGVVGAGSWGTALANLLANQGYPIDLWVYEEDVKQQIQIEKENKVFLPGIRLSPYIAPSNDLAEVVDQKDMILMVTPSHLTRTVAEQMSPHVSKNTIVISASKGIENETFLTMCGVLEEILTHVPKENLSVLSGPSFANEVAVNVPTVVTVASKSLDVACQIQKVFSSPFFRVYTSNDVIGVELSGAVKNIIAIAAGIVDGLKLGLNTRAALITRGLVEINRLGVKLNANPQTFSGLAGMGDLILTCTGTLSRNHTVGKKIGEGQKLDDILSEMRMVAEGVKTTKSVYNLSRKLECEMPITEAIYSILYENLSPINAVHKLMTRDLKHEIEGD